MNTHERSLQSAPVKRARLAGFAVAALIPFGILLALTGCGGGAAESSGGKSDTQLAVHSPEGQTVPAQAAAVSPSAGSAERLVSTSEDLSPDLMASVPDTVVTPGESVEVTALATPDAMQLLLWDGTHDRQLFAYDSTTTRWRASYRVPLEPSSERLGLSVTARNAADHWRRVWVFLRVERPEAVDPTR